MYIYYHLKVDICAAFSPLHIQMLYFDVVVMTGEPSILKRVRKWCKAKRIAQRVIEASPTLAYIVINLDDRLKTDRLSYWVVIGDESSAGCRDF